ncbi:MAG: hypothetical protein AB1553_15935 [Nitrospirota bacterium]
MFAPIGWDMPYRIIISEDPIEFEGGDANLYSYYDSVGKPPMETNLYMYTGNNPINRVDPLGLFWGGTETDSGVMWETPTCTAALYEMASLAAQVHAGQIGDKRGHCLAHCEVRKACGKGFGDALSKVVGYGKEFYDKVRGGMSGKRSWDDKDIAANEQGRTCPEEKSCEEQCKNLWR